MPLTKGQIVVLRILAAARDPESYVAGSTPLNVDPARFSGDIDIFHDSAERVALAADTDAATLAAAGHVNSLYPAEEWRRLASSEPIDPQTTTVKLRDALEAAHAFASRMPTDKAGALFLDGDKVVQPDPARLGDYVEHRGRRRGHWPSNPDIAAAMMARYRS